MQDKFYQSFFLMLDLGEATFVLRIETVRDISWVSRFILEILLTKF